MRMTASQAKKNGLTTFNPKPYPHKQTFRFPWPPSVNGLYVTNMKTGRRHLSERAKKFLAVVQDHLIEFGAKPYYDSRIGVRVECHEPGNSRRTRDIQNLEKITSDAMAKGGLFDDDGQIDDIRFIRREPSDIHEGYIDVEVWPITEGETSENKLGSD